MGGVLGGGGDGGARGIWEMKNEILVRWLVKSKKKWGQVVVSFVEGYLVVKCMGVL